MIALLIPPAPPDFSDLCFMNNASNRVKVPEDPDSTARCGAWAVGRKCLAAAWAQYVSEKDKTLKELINVLEL